MGSVLLRGGDPQISAYGGNLPKNAAEQFILSCQSRTLPRFSARLRRAVAAPRRIMIGDVVIVIDPNTRKPLSFSAYRIEAEGISLNFAAGRLSDGSWGFFDYDE